MSILSVILPVVFSLNMLIRMQIPGESLDRFQWLIGTWENNTSRGRIYETWKKVNTYEFSGKSYLLKDKDTIFLETIRLVQKSDSIYYIPTIANQNNALPVKFKLKMILNNKMVFENKHHDFPQVIAYTKISADSLVAAISGIKNGKEVKREFPMRKIR